MTEQPKSRHTNTGASSTTDAAPRMTRRAWIGLSAVGVVGVLAGSQFLGRDGAASDAATNGGVGTASGASDAAGATDVMVYKSPTCGCCEKWIEHMQQNGFTVRFEDIENVVPIKQRYGVPQELWSCHTSVIGKYTFEGHVPADLVRKVLSEKPRAVGLAVPGMPPASPGMDQGNAPYEVLLFTRDGKSTLYATR